MQQHFEWIDFAEIKMNIQACQQNGGLFVHGSYMILYMLDIHGTVAAVNMVISLLN